MLNGLSLHLFSFFYTAIKRLLCIYRCIDSFAFIFHFLLIFSWLGGYIHQFSTTYMNLGCLNKSLNKDNRISLSPQSSPPALPGAQWGKPDIRHYLSSVPPGVLLVGHAWNTSPRRCTGVLVRCADHLMWLLLIYRSSFIVGLLWVSEQDLNHYFSTCIQSQIFFFFAKSQQQWRQGAL